MALAFATLVFFFDLLDLVANDAAFDFVRRIAEFFVAEFLAHDVADFLLGPVGKGFVAFAVFFGGPAAGAVVAPVVVVGAAAVVRFLVALQAILSHHGGVVTHADDLAADGDLGL